MVASQHTDPKYRGDMVRTLASGFPRSARPQTIVSSDTVVSTASCYASQHHGADWADPDAEGAAWQAQNTGRYHQQVVAGLKEQRTWNP
jgi:hypothetical protein